MGDLTRRDEDAIPVQARRTNNRYPLPAQVPLGPIEIEVPPGQAPPVVPPPASGITQNIIYVVTPPPTQIVPPVAPPAQPPQEVHYHQTTNHISLGKRRTQKGISFFGRLAVLAGLLACGCAYLAATTEYVKPIAEAGLALGALGFIVSTLFRRSGRTVPVLGILVSAAAFPLLFSRTGQLQSQYDQLRTKSQGVLPAIDLSGKNAAGQVAPESPSTPSKASAVPPVTTPHPTNDHSIFGDSGGWQKPGDVTTPTTPNTPASPSINQPVTVTPQTAVQRTESIAAAQANLEIAREHAAKRLGVDYASAKATAMSAATAYQQAKIKYDLQSPELITASQNQLTAESQLRSIESSLDNDPEVAAAEQALKSHR